MGGLREIVVDPFENPSPSSSDYVEVYVGDSCGQAVTSFTPTTSDIVVPIDPGFAVPAGGAVGVKVFGNVHISITFFGYTVGCAIGTGEAPPRGAGDHT